MRQLLKSAEPEVLTKNKIRWTEELLSLIKNKQDVPKHIAGRYSHKEIKETLKKETFEKCIYCESKITQVYHGDIEHIIPKKVAPELTFDWQNLGFSCAVCNNKKSDYYDKEDPLLNPYQENPQNHIYFFGVMVMSQWGSDRGQITVNRLDLNRVELIERRKERIEKVESLIRLWRTEKKYAKKNMLWGLIEEEAASSREHSLLIDTFINNYLKSDRENTDGALVEKTQETDTS